MRNTNVSPLNKSVAIHQQIEDAAQEAVAIRISRDELDDGWLNGFVVAVGTNLFAMELISDAIYLDGFVCLRIEDVSCAEFPAPHWSFTKSALSLRGQDVSEALPVDCSTISTVLRSIPQSAGLIAVHTEDLDSDVCHIGKIADLNEKSLTLDTISPDATWHDEQMVFELLDVTRIDFGGAYEDALLLVQINAKP